MTDRRAPSCRTDHESSCAMASGTTSHICVCVCTYKRPELLRRLLEELARQQTDGLFTFSVVVVDNDSQESAKAEVLDFARYSSIPASYQVEPRQNISLARNRALAGSSGAFIALIDDDEFPSAIWLLTLFNALHEHAADGVLGPVQPFFDRGVPKWIVKGRFFERPSYRTGLIIDGKKGRTGNALIKRQLCVGEEQPFRPEFRSGEDQDFFERMIQKGHVFVWCNEATVYETIPPARWKRTFMLRKALLQGECSTLNPSQRMRQIARSLIAIPLYAMASPFALLFGQHNLMILLVKLFDHIGQLLGVMGVDVVKQAYVTE